MSRHTTFAGLALAGSLAAATAVTAQANLTAETSGGGASNHVAMVALGEIAAEQGLANFQILDGQVLTNSLANLVAGQSDIVATPFILPFLMSRGAGPYASVGPEQGAEDIKKASVLFTYTFGGMSLYAFDSSSVHGWGDIEGKKILNGPPQGAALANGRALIQIVTGLKDGEGYEGVQVDWGQAVKTMTDGSVDAMVLPVYLPDPRMTQASASGAMTLYSVPMEIIAGEAFQKYITSPGTGYLEVPIAGTGLPDEIKVVSEDDTFRSPTTTGGMVVSTDMDDELAYALTRAYLDNLDRFEAKAPIMKWVALGAVDPTVTGMCGANPLKFHPAAARAYADTGRTLPECALP
ncbi:MAG: C4-dicarboxylate ABC transporter substrate-binding protein [Maritimibacter sp.]|nr:C4-dicarboxylate ABC transporter substrate-binding protein [Maritimibacter sp.]